MKNISRQALEAYTTLLKYSQLKVNHEIKFRDVQLSNNNHIHEIYTSKVNKLQTPHLVLLHGFAGSAMSYIRTFHNLSKHFHVHALDHFGNGFSSRNNLNKKKKSQQQLVSLYIDSIQEWRKSIGITNIVLVGHSFGGYLATLYALKHIEVVDRLIILSPVGTSNQKQIQEQIQNKKSESLKNKIMLNLVQKIYNLKIQPSKAFNIPFLGDVLVNSFLKSKIKLQKEQKQMWKQYIKLINQQESHLQKSFYQCFTWPFISKLSSISENIEKIIESSQSKTIQFYYGEKDWTQQIGAIKLSKKYKNVNFQIIPKATHNMIFDFPYQVADRIISGPLNDRIQFAKI